MPRIPETGTPGLLTPRVVGASDIGRRVLSAPRPSFYFRPAKWVAEASLSLVMPECLAARGEATAREMIAAEVERQQAEARAYVKEMGWSVGGRVAAQNVSPYRCATSWRELGKLTPHVAAGRGSSSSACIDPLSTDGSGH